MGFWGFGVLGAPKPQNPNLNITKFELIKIKLKMLEGPKIVENLFFAVTCISIFTCTIRSDYNFAMGLLCYYLIKNARDKIRDTALTVSYSLIIIIYSVDLFERINNSYGYSMVHYYEVCLGW